MFLSIFVICGIFNSHFDIYEVMSHCGFNFHFSDDQKCWASCMYLLIICRSFPYNIYINLLSILKWIFFFFGLLENDLYEFFICLEYWSLISHIFCKYFLIFSRLSVVSGLFGYAELLNLCNFAFISFVWGDRVKKNSRFYVSILHMFSSRSFMV